MRQFTLEVRLSLQDKGSNDAMKVLMRHLARQARMTAVLCGDPNEPNVVAIYSDDFFEGHEALNQSEPIYGYEG